MHFGILVLSSFSKVFIVGTILLSIWWSQKSIETL